MAWDRAQDGRWHAVDGARAGTCTRMGYSVVYPGPASAFVLAEWQHGACTCATSEAKSSDSNGRRPAIISK